MSKLILKYIDILLIILAIAILSFLVIYFVWEISSLAKNLSKAIANPGEKNGSISVRFDFDQLEKLNLKNLRP